MSNLEHQIREVVPQSIRVSGVTFPLGSDRWGVWIVQDARLLGLRPLSYVVAHLCSQRLGSDRTLELEERRDFSLHLRLSATVVGTHNRDQLGDGVANWTKLAGQPPDLDDAYLVGTPFLSELLVVPRHTLIQLVERLGTLHDRVIALGRRSQNEQADATPATLRGS
ncbi:MAG TPA: hypothetical protein VHV51_24305 [Polyangiaceae bacterium]|nr:hypothetical protein [Polyangiaceae bacterium]